MTESWNDLISTLPGAHFLQTSQWAEIKRQYGWKPYFLCWIERGNQVEMLEWKAGLPVLKAAALVLERSFIRKRYLPEATMLYLPKGPMLSWQDRSLVQKVLADLVGFCHKRNAVFIKMDSDLTIGSFPVNGSLTHDMLSSEPARFFANQGWIFSKEQVQFRNTFRIDLTADEEQLLGSMKQKTRYNIRLSQRKGVTIRQGTELDLERLFEMYRETAARDGFVIREAAYYKAVWQKFIQAEMANVLIAEYQSQPVAAVLLIRFARKSWFVYGMSTSLHRDKMPNYLLQWEAMKCARRHGCEVYDFWGAPNELHEGDPLWGVYRFKEGFGGRFTRTTGAWDYPGKKLAYFGFTHLYPMILGFMKINKKTKNHDIVQI